MNNKGYTFIEIIAVLIILAILASIVVIKYDGLNRGAKDTALKLAISELNEIEKLSWGQVKVSTDGWVDDSTLFNLIKSGGRYELGSNTSWESLTRTGGILRTNAGSKSLTRIESTNKEPATWK
jgi:prepilin-type N-terminal cleavage/methylation domain-containing protein